MTLVASTARMRDLLLRREWKRIRHGPKEPWFYKDPLGLEEHGQRVQMAYALQLKRDKYEGRGEP
jgi:hypothetical protein